MTTFLIETNYSDPCQIAAESHEAALCAYLEIAGAPEAARLIVAEESGPWRGFMRDGDEFQTVEIAYGWN